MFIEEWMSDTMTEVHPAAIHSCQKGFSTTTLLHAGRVAFLCRGWGQWHSTEYWYMVTTMLLLWWELQINIWANQSKIYSKRTKEDDRNTPKPEPGEEFSCQRVCVWIATHQSRNPSSNYQASIRLHQISNKEKKEKKINNAQEHGFKGLECKLFLKSIQAVMWSCVRWKHIQCSTGLTKRFQISFGIRMLGLEHILLQSIIITWWKLR